MLYYINLNCHDQRYIILFLIIRNISTYKLIEMFVKYINLLITNNIIIF